MAGVAQFEVRFAPTRLACDRMAHGFVLQNFLRRCDGCVTGWHMALFCRSREVEHCGTFWSAGGELVSGDGREAAETQRARRGGRGMNERHGAKGAKGRAPRGGSVLRAHVGPPMDRSVVRVWDPFCAPDFGEVWFSRGKWGEIFLFFVGGGLRGWTKWGAMGGVSVCELRGGRREKHRLRGKTRARRPCHLWKLERQ